jgi:hypothetical protein
LPDLHLKQSTLRPPMSSSILPPPPPRMWTHASADSCSRSPSSPTSAPPTPSLLSRKSSLPKLAYLQPKRSTSSLRSPSFSTSPRPSASSVQTPGSESSWYLLSDPEPSSPARSPCVALSSRLQLATVDYSSDIEDEDLRDALSDSLDVKSEVGSRGMLVGGKQQAGGLGVETEGKSNGWFGSLKKLAKKKSNSVLLPLQQHSTTIAKASLGAGRLARPLPPSSAHTDPFPLAFAPRRSLSASIRAKLSGSTSDELSSSPSSTITPNHYPPRKFASCQALRQHADAQLTSPPRLQSIRDRSSSFASNPSLESSSHSYSHDSVESHASTSSHQHEPMVVTPRTSPSKLSNPILRQHFLDRTPPRVDLSKRETVHFSSTLLSLATKSFSPIVEASPALGNEERRDLHPLSSAPDYFPSFRTASFYDASSPEDATPIGMTRPSPCFISRRPQSPPSSQSAPLLYTLRPPPPASPLPISPAATLPPCHPIVTARSPSLSPSLYLLSQPLPRSPAHSALPTHPYAATIAIEPVASIGSLRVPSKSSRPAVQRPSSPGPPPAKPLPRPPTPQLLFTRPVSISSLSSRRNSKQLQIQNPSKLCPTAVALPLKAKLARSPSSSSKTGSTTRPTPPTVRRVPSVKGKGKKALLSRSESGRRKMAGVQFGTRAKTPTTAIGCLKEEEGECEEGSKRLGSIALIVTDERGLASGGLLSVSILLRRLGLAISHAAAIC